jgi:hypothetical protein
MSDDKFMDAAILSRLCFSTYVGEFHGSCKEESSEKSGEETRQEKSREKNRQEEVVF